jgi:tetratricopeptide (TPR) repeat protein
MPSLRTLVAFTASLFLLTGCSELKKLANANSKMPPIDDSTCSDHVDAEEWAAAIKSFDELIEKKPDDANLWGWRAYCYEQAGNKRKAIEDATKALTLAPAADWINDIRGDSYRALKKYKEAVADYSVEIKAKPEDANNWLSRAEAYDDMKDFEHALSDYNKALELNSTLTQAMNDRGWLYVEQKDYQKAIEDFDACLQEDDKYTSAYYNRAGANMALGKLDEALVDMKHLSDQDPAEIQCFSTRGFVYLLKKDPERAVKEFSTALDLSSDESTAQWQRIYLYLTYKLMNKPEKAERILKDSFTDADSNNWPYAALVYLNGKINDKVLLDLCSDDYERSDARLVIALMQTTNGESAKAKESWMWLKEHAVQTDRSYFVAAAALNDPTIFGKVK